ncbi:MAG: hypothetical protein AB1697_05895 [Pseudomonadota bacterium]
MPQNGAPWFAQPGLSRVHSERQFLSAAHDRAGQSIANASAPARAAVLEALDSRYDGFTPIDDKAYNSVRRLIQPFQNPAPISAHN